MHNLLDDHCFSEKIIEMMLLVPVRISIRNQVPLHPAHPILSNLGDCSLGVDFTTGNALYNEGADEILVSIGPVKNEILHEFMPGGNKNKILQMLCDYLLPVHVDVVTEIELDNKDKVTKLADEASDLNSVLGQDTYL
jgi:hypothetical protein